MNNSSRIKEFLQEDLRKSGLTPESFKVEPLRDEEELRKRLGFTVVNGTHIIDVGGYWIEFPNERGYYRLKLMEEIKDERGHKIKYLSPLKSKGKGNHVYIPVGVERLLKEYTPGLEIGLVEGEKKAQAATDAGIPTIGLPGIWNTNDEDNDFLPELEQCNWKDKAIKIAFDSDMTLKPQVKQAELRAAVKFINHGADAYSVRLPNEPDGDKNGADDFIVRYGKMKYLELNQQARHTIELLIREDMKTEEFVKEIARLNSKLEKERIALLIRAHTKIPVSTIRAELAKHTSKADKETTADSKAETFTEEEIYAAEALLKNPQLLSLAVKQTEKTGHVMEVTNKKILFLAFVSRLLTESVSCVIKGMSAAGKNALANAVLCLFPKSVYFDYTSISATTLYYKKDFSLAHKILIIYEAHGSEQADYAIRSSISEGKLKREVTIKNPETGKMETQMVEVPAEGFVFVETTTKETIHRETQTRVVDINIDESKETTQAIMDAMSELAARPINKEALEKELRIWQCAQTLLKPYTVVIPFAPELPKEFPAHKTRARRDYPRFLALIRAHAILHQYQRKVDENGCLIATIDDLKGILPLVEKSVMQSMSEMTPKKREVLTLIAESFPQENLFSVKDVQKQIQELINKYNYIKTNNINSFPNNDNKLSEKDWELIFKLKDIVSGEMPYPTLGAHIKSFAESGYIEWNGERGRGSKYSHSLIPGEININSTILSPKLLETLEKNYINPENINNINSFNGTSEESEVAQEGKGAVQSEGQDPGNGEPKEPETAQGGNGSAHSEACDCSKCCPIPKRNTNGRRPNNSITKTIVIEEKPVKLDYDKEAGTITVEREGEEKVLSDDEVEYEEYFHLGRFGN